MSVSKHADPLVRKLPRWLVPFAMLAVVAAGCSSEAAGDGAAASATPSASPTDAMSAEDAKTIDDAANEIVGAHPELPGLWVGVWDPEKGTYLAAYGDAVDGSTPASVDDHNRIGSVTKTFTAVAVLQQVDAGELSLDDTIGDVCPDMAETYPDLAEITVEQLLAMRSGIPDYANTGAVTGSVVEDPTKVWTVDEIIATTLEEEPLEEPGTPGYSTTNYLILGEMLEAVTGESVEDVINGVATEARLAQSALQEPAETQMPDPSSHGYLNEPGVASLAEAGITAEPGQDVTDWTVSWGQAGGGMYSTIADMGAWAASGLGNSLLSPETAAERLEAQPIPEGNYGLGIFVYEDGWIGHSGQLIGWESFVLSNTETGAAFVLLVNETGSLGTALPIADVAFPGLIESIA
jgi:D-alanyl-D-alanine carboxypeptidase